jgi:hypothetical protein
MEISKRQIQLKAPLAALFLLGMLAVNSTAYAKPLSNEQGKTLAPFNYGSSHANHLIAC